MLPLVGARLATVWTRDHPTHAPCTVRAVCRRMHGVCHVIRIPVLGGVYMRAPSWGPKSSPAITSCKMEKNLTKKRRVADRRGDGGTKTAETRLLPRVALSPRAYTPTLRMPIDCADVLTVGVQPTPPPKPWCAAAGSHR